MSFIASQKNKNLKSGAEKLQYIINYYDSLNYQTFKLAQIFEATKLKQSLTGLVPKDQMREIYDYLRRISLSKSNWALIMDNILNLIDHLFYSSVVYQITELKQINKMIDQIKQKLLPDNKYNTIENTFSNQIKDIMHDSQAVKLLAQNKKAIKDKIEKVKKNMSQKLERIQTNNKNEVQVFQFIKSIQEKRLMKAVQYEQMVINKINQTKNVVTKFINIIEKSGGLLVQQIRNKSKKQIRQFKLKVLQEEEKESQNKFKKQSLQSKNYKSILKNKISQKHTTFDDDGINDIFEVRLNNVKQFLLQIYPQNRKNIIKDLMTRSSIQSSKHIQIKPINGQGSKLQTIEEYVDLEKSNSVSQNVTNSEFPTEYLNTETNQSNQFTNNQNQSYQQETINSLHIKYCRLHKLSPQYKIQQITHHDNLQFQMYGEEDPMNSKKFIINFICEIDFINLKGVGSSFTIYQNVSEKQIPTVIESVKSGKKTIVIDDKQDITFLMMKRFPKTNIVQIKKSRMNVFSEMFKKIYQGITKQIQISSRKLQQQLISQLKEDLKFEIKTTNLKAQFQVITQRVLQSLQPK